MKSDLVDLDVKVHHETELAVKVSLDGDIKNAVWPPKSQILIRWTSFARATITLPQPLAEEKGLV